MSSSRADVADTVPSCWVCGSPQSTEWKPRRLGRPLASDDLKITDSHYGTTLALFRCEHCGFIFADATELVHLVSLYEDLVDDEYERTETARALQMRWLLRHIRQFHSTASSLLDVGAGTGLLVDEATRLGMDAVGVEPSLRLVEGAHSRGRTTVLCGTLPHQALAGRVFDVVTLIDVIEHVTQPVLLLQQCGAALARDGVLVIVTPDVASVAARLLRGRWWHFRLAHVGYFDRRSLEHAGVAAGLIPVHYSYAKWFLPFEYLATRLERYLPIGSFNRFARRVPLFRRLYRSTVPVNLYDSLVALLRRPEDRG